MKLNTFRSNWCNVLLDIMDAMRSYRFVACEVEGASEKAKKPDDPNALPRKWKTAEHAEGKRQQDLEQRNCTKYHYLKFIEEQIPGPFIQP